eukprot:3961362-Prymnesium_polylepis.1
MRCTGPGPVKGVSRPPTMPSAVPWCCSSKCIADMQLILTMHRSPPRHTRRPTRGGVGKVGEGRGSR